MKFAALSLGFIGSLFCLTVHAATPMTLQQCYDSALAYNNRVAISKAEIDVARARFLQVLGEVLPQISFRMSVLLQDPSNGGGNANDVQDTFTRLSRTEGSFNFQQYLFHGLKEFHGLKIATLGRTLAEQERINLERLLFQDVATAYYTIALIERSIETNQNIVSVMQARIRELKHRVDLGRSRLGELTQEQATLALIEARLAQQIGEKTVAYEMMSFLTGMEPMPRLAWYKPQTAANDGLDYYLAQSRVRPDVQAAQTDVKIAKNQIGIARGNFLPEVKLDANLYTFRPGFQSNIRWDVGITGEVPLFRLQNFGEFKAAKLQHKQSELAAEQTRRIVAREVKAAYNHYQSSRAYYGRYRRAGELGYQNFMLQSDDFKLGRATNLDVLTAQRTWLDSLEQRNRAEVQTWLDWTELQIAAGILP